MKESIIKTMKFIVRVFVLGFIVYLLVQLTRGTTNQKEELFIAQGSFTFQRLVITDFYNERQGKSFEIKEFENIIDICGLLEMGKRTDIDSVSDLPHRNRVTVVQFFVAPDSSGGRVTLYKDNGKEYLDQPFEKLYELPEGSLQKIRNIYIRKGTVVDMELLH